MKKIASWLLILSLVLSLMPIEAFAAENADTSTEPKLLSLIAHNSNGESASLLDGSASIDLGKTYSFTVTFSNADQIDKVYVTSTRFGETKLLEAVRNGSTFVTNGSFDANENYIPGKIGVEYTKKVSTININAPVDWTSLQTDIGDQCAATIHSASGEAVQATVDISKLLDSEIDVAVDFAIDVFDTVNDTDLDGFLGKYRDFENLAGFKADDYFAYVDFTDSSTYAMIVKDVSGNKIIKMVLNEAGEFSQPLSVIAQNLGKANSISSIAYSSLSTVQSADELRREIASRPTISTQEKTELTKKVDAYENDRLLFNLSMAVIPTVVAASGGTMIGPALVLNALLGAMNAASGTFWNYRIGMISGCDPIDAQFTGDAHGIPLTLKYLKEIDYGKAIESGNYCLDLPDTHITVEAGVSIVLCTHGYSCVVTNNGGSVAIYNCKYSGDASGGASVTNNGGDVIIDNGGAGIANYGGNVIIEDGYYSVSNKTVEGGHDPETVIYGGRSGYIENGGGTVDVYDGSVHRITSKNGITHIHGGMFGGREDDSGSPAVRIDGGIVTVSGGTFANNHGKNTLIKAEPTIDNRTGGTLYITGGEIVGDGSSVLKNESGGTVEIRGGTISGGINNSGAIEIYKGTVIGQIDNTGEMTIYNGAFLIETAKNIDNRGILTIEGGTFKAPSEIDYSHNHNFPGPYPNYNVYSYGNSSTTINGGNFYSEWGCCAYNGGNNSSMTIDGGDFYSADGCCIDNRGIMIIDAGTFTHTSKDALLALESDCVVNRGESLTIRGGIFCESGHFGDCISTNNDNLVISGGKFKSPDGSGMDISWDADVIKYTLLIAKDSNIEIDSLVSAFRNDSKVSVIVKAENDYNGGVTYFSSKDASGIKMNIEEANEIDFSTPYVRLVADNVPIDKPTDCEHSYTSKVTLPTCTERGYTTHTCNLCGTSYKDSYTDALGHSYDEWVITTAATATANGQRERICSRCSSKETEAIPATGNGNTTNPGNNTNPSVPNPGYNPGNSGTPTVTLPTAPSNSVSTSNTQNGYQTTASPNATVNGNAATCTVNTSTANEIVKQAVSSKSESIVITPKVTGNAAKTEVSIPASTVGQIGDQTNASLTVSTPMADVSIPNGGLGSLSSVGGTVTVAAEKKGSTVELSITAGGKLINRIPGGVTLSVLLESTTPGTVAMLVHENGTKEVVRKSVISGENITIPLDGSAKLEIVDNSKSFADVPATSWAADAVAFVSAHELFNGTGENQFSPDLPMSRGMLAVVLHNLENNPSQAFTNMFADVNIGTWYAEGVAWAAAQGIVGGYGNGQFGPNDNITREQLAVMLWRYAGSPSAVNRELRFTDAYMASDWALDALFWATEKGIVNGKGNGILDPTGFATRAETAQMLKNFIEK